VCQGLAPVLHSLQEGALPLNIAVGEYWWPHGGFHCGAPTFPMAGSRAPQERLWTKFGQSSSNPCQYDECNLVLDRVISLTIPQPSVILYHFRRYLKSFFLLTYSGMLLNGCPFLSFPVVSKCHLIMDS
jgi:hypothetical protein